MRAATRIEPAGVGRLVELCDLAEEPGATTDDHIAYNEEFHALIVAAAQSPRLLAALHGVAGIPRAFRAAFWADSAQLAQSMFCRRGLGRALELARSDVSAVM